MCPVLEVHVCYGDLRAISRAHMNVSSVTLLAAF